jgi:hypothetical protein
MPRFYLHMWDGNRLVEDEDGVELSDSNAAVLLAKRSLGEMLCHDVMANRDLSGRRIVVADEARRTIADVCAPVITVTQPPPEASTDRVSAAR